VDAWGDAAGADAMAEAAGAEDDGARLSHQS
jgi:hypothetical protein